MSPLCKKAAAARGRMRGSARGFSLIELLAAVAVLMLVVALFNQIFTATSRVSQFGGRSLDTSADARVLFDRMALDFAGMLKRDDIDYYLKSATLSQPGNDRMAFFSEAGGFFTANTWRSPLALVCYRWNPTRRHIERVGTGLQWSTAGGLGSSLVYLPMKIGDTWPFVSSDQTNADAEALGPEVFRFEYYYILRGRTEGGKYYPPIASDTLWDTRLPNFRDVSTLHDVASIVVTIAVIDPRSRKIVTDAQLDSLSQHLADFVPGMTIDELATKWREAVQNNGGIIPQQALAGIHIYQRSFNLDPLPVSP